MFCKFCGTQVEDNMVNCPNCGGTLTPTQSNDNQSYDQQNNNQQNYNGQYNNQQNYNGQYNNQQYYNGQYQQPPYQQPYEQPSGNFGWGVLGFFFPIVGLILYLVWKNDPVHFLDAKVAGKGALISVIVFVAFYLFLFVIAFIAISLSGYSIAFNFLNFIF